MLRLARVLQVPALALWFVACADATGSDGFQSVFPISIAVLTEFAVPLSASAGRGALFVQGGPGLTCGVSRASGTAGSRDGALTITLTLRPLGSCPFAPIDGRYAAIVSAIPSGWYDVEVRQHYWDDRPDDTLQVRLFVAR
jgi:hypothetical protein